MGSKGGGTTQTIQKADPWYGIQGPLMQLYTGALENFNAPGPEYYPGSTVAPQGQVTQLAQQGLFNRATQGNPLTSTAQQQLGRTLSDQYFETPATAGLMNTASGAMLNANPYVDAMFNRAAGQVGEQFRKNVMPGIASQFAGAGRYGSGAMADVMGQAEQQYGNTLTGLASDIYGKNYATERLMQEQARGELGTQFGRERALQMSGLGLAPNLAQADYADIGQLGQLGSQMDAYNQQLLNADINRFDYYQNLPTQKLSQLNQLLQGGMGLSGTSSQSTAPNMSNPAMGALGGGMMGAQLGSSLGVAGPWGALAGAVLGGLFS